ncbi:uncharacterized protein KY384_006755 [Bacidia gigantensis]|uniref:uncharacterized protein n=1 Tax=Bacidia gigantensis TaxID=2732470 RepID=UPI001D048E18|nr:uncharacterized protein KY384_006755 [Bacidia gigantensis]KAG8527839.1 hypothetical protein KY384_006755 [Bacidia gigantensis]
MAVLPRGTNGGIERGPLPPNTPRTAILVAMLTLAIYMAVLVDIKVLSTFKRRNTLYFWSILITSCGIVSHSTGIILKWFVGSCPWEVNTAFASFGWWGMVTGQSLVLYSRLHIVVRDQRVLRGVLIMIITDFILFQFVTTVLTFGSNQPNPGLWLKIYNIYERIQLIVFTLQELTISIIYIRAALKILLPSDPTEIRHTKKFLIYLNILCIVLDIAFVCEVYSGEWVYKTGTQSLAYAIKLTIEFVVLNKLMDVYRLGPGACTACRRKINPNSQQYQHSNRSVDGKRPTITRGSSSQGIIAGWPRSKPKGAERLGPFEEEELKGVDVGKGVTRSHVKAAPSDGGVKEGDIMIVTDMISSSEASNEGKQNGR